MTPTLRGRWQTRLLLFATLGAGISLLFALWHQNFRAAFALLGYMLLFGLVWDVVYAFLQSLRWDRDWSPALYLLSAVWEGVFLWFAIQLAHRYGFPAGAGLPGAVHRLGIGAYAGQFSAVWLVCLLAMFGPLKILFPRWRFKGGQWW